MLCTPAMPRSAYDRHDQRLREFGVLRNADSACKVGSKSCPGMANFQSLPCTYNPIPSFRHQKGPLIMHCLGLTLSCFLLCGSAAPADDPIFAPDAKLYWIGGVEEGRWAAAGRREGLRS